SQYSFNATICQIIKPYFCRNTWRDNGGLGLTIERPWYFACTILPGILPFNKGMALQGGSTKWEVILVLILINAVGYEPYLCDGTVTGATLLKNINQTTGNGYHNKHSRQSEFFQFNGKVFLMEMSGGIKGGRNMGYRHCALRQAQLYTC
ncbi:MAG: hypothetical protein IPQ19_07310, partial [Bacteroidetes bacterium]|nr:hypothetical protein [Bacteroidota bacterium]